MHVEDHIDAIITVLKKGGIGQSYCIGGQAEKKNIEIAHLICSYLDEISPNKSSYKELIKFVKDRPGHDLRYAINAEKIKRELNWKPKISFENGLRKTIEWYLENMDWLNKTRKI